tara:strand:- start:1238 stop:1339 length:102 start_codon:yes stop_codon:yes gene_type:complete
MVTIDIDFQMFGSGWPAMIKKHGAPVDVFEAKL